MTSVANDQPKKTMNSHVGNGTAFLPDTSWYSDRQKSTNHHNQRLQVVSCCKPEISSGCKRIATRFMRGARQSSFPRMSVKSEVTAHPLAKLIVKALTKAASRTARKEIAKDLMVTQTRLGLKRRPDIGTPWFHSALLLVPFVVEAFGLADAVANETEDTHCKPLPGNGWAPTRCRLTSHGGTACAGANAFGYIFKGFLFVAIP